MLCIEKHIKSFNYSNDELKQVKKVIKAKQPKINAIIKRKIIYVHQVKFSEPEDQPIQQKYGSNIVYLLVKYLYNYLKAIIKAIYT